MGLLTSCAPSDVQAKATASFSAGAHSMLRNALDDSNSEWQHSPRQELKAVSVEPKGLGLVAQPAEALPRGFERLGQQGGGHEPHSNRPVPHVYVAMMPAANPISPTEAPMSLEASNMGGNNSPKVGSAGFNMLRLDKVVDRTTPNPNPNPDPNPDPNPSPGSRY